MCLECSVAVNGTLARYKDDEEKEMKGITIKHSCTHEKNG